MEKATTVGTSKPLEDRIKVLKKDLNKELKPLLEENVKLREKQKEEENQLASLLERKNTGKDGQEALEKQIQLTTIVLQNLTRLAEICEGSMAEVEAKYLPDIDELERQVQDRVRAEIPPEYKISNRLEAVAKKMEKQNLSKNLSSLCGNLDWLSNVGYQKLGEIFKPIESDVSNNAFKRFYKTLKYFLKRLPVSSLDQERKREFLSMPFFFCGLDGMNADFELDFEVSVNDKCSKLNGKADIIIHCGNVEIIVIEEKRGGTTNQDRAESAIPQALVEMDCLSKNRLSVECPDFQLNKNFSYGIVTDCIRWFFLKLGIDGNYSISDCYELPGNIIGKESRAELWLIRSLCMRIRGLVEEAMK